MIRSQKRILIKRAKIARKRSCLNMGTLLFLPRDRYSRGVRLLSSRLRPFGTANAGLGERNPLHFSRSHVFALGKPF